MSWNNFIFIERAAELRVKLCLEQFNSPYFIIIGQTFASKTSPLETALALRRKALHSLWSARRTMLSTSPPGLLTFVTSHQSHRGIQMRTKNLSKLAPSTMLLCRGRPPLPPIASKTSPGGLAHPSPLRATEMIARG